MAKEGSGQVGTPHSVSPWDCLLLVDDALREVDGGFARCAADAAARPPGGAWPDAVRRVIEVLPRGFRFPDRLAVGLRIGSEVVARLDSVSNAPVLSRPIVVGGKPVGEIQVGFESRPLAEEGTGFLPEEARLLEAVADRFARELRMREVEAELERARRGLFNAEAGLERVKRRLSEAETGLERLHRQLGDAEADLRWADSFQRAFTESSPLAVFSISLEGVVLTWNQAAERIFGWSADEVVGTSLPIVPTGSEEEFAAIRNRIASGASLAEVPLVRRRKDGSSVDVSLSGAPVFDAAGHPKAILAAVADVTEALRTRRRLHLLNEAVEAAANPIMITDVQGEIEWVNPAFTAATGYTAEEAVGRTPGSLLSSGVHGPEFFRDFWATLSSGRVWSGRMVNRRKDGTLYPEEQTVTPVRDASGAITHFIAVKLDVTAREEAWRRITFQADLLDAVGQAVVATDEAGRVTYWNRAAEDLFGWRAEEVLGHDGWELISPQEPVLEPKDRLEGTRGIGPGARTGGVGGAAAGGAESWTGECELRRRDGSVFPGLVSDSTIPEGEGAVLGEGGPEGEVGRERASAAAGGAGRRNGRIRVVSDLTELKDLESRLRQAHKMEAVGRLASGVAHDFNNLLTVIHGQAQMVLDDLPSDSRLREEMLEILEEVRRSARLTKQLLAFGRRQVLEETVLDLRDVLEKLRPMLRRLIPSRIELHLESIPESCLVRVDPSQIEQVVLNLAVNAVDALATTGRISFDVDTRMVAASDEEYLRIGLGPGSYVRLIATDDGCGIPPEVVGRIFEPFFTTKPEGEGTGLGLSTVFGIVTQSGGGLRVGSAPGKGSRFEILLPRIQGRESMERKEVAAVDRDGEGGPTGETILLVEDTASVRKVARKILERAGYVVLQASNGLEALQLASAHLEAIDLVVTDVVMPGMGGGSLLERIREMRPDLPVVLASGHSADELSEELRIRASGFLGKPFRSSDLTRVVRDALT